MARRFRIGLRHHDGDVGGGRCGREPFLAVEHIVALAILDGGGLHAGRVGAGGFLGHRIADALFAIDQRLQVFLFLEVRAVGEQRQHGRIVRALRIHRQRAEMAVAEFHLHQRVCEGAEAHAAMLDREERKPEALLAGFRAQLFQYGLVGLAGRHFLFGGKALVLHPEAHALAHFLGVFRNREIDGHSFSPCSFEREANPEPAGGKDCLRVRPGSRRVRGTGRPAGPPGRRRCGLRPRGFQPSIRDVGSRARPRRGCRPSSGPGGAGSFGRCR